MEELTFENREIWRNWLAKNHDSCDGIWLVYFKKHTEKPSVSYNDAVEEALCFGWIDSIIKSIDNEQYKQKYTPRRKNSVWSKVNKARIEKMMKLGKMTEFGLKKIEEAKQNGQWEKAYSVSDEVEMPEEFKAGLAKDKLAFSNYFNFSKSNQTTYLRWYLAAKRPETREKRLKQIIEFARENKKPGIV